MEETKNPTNNTEDNWPENSLPPVHLKRVEVPEIIEVNVSGRRDGEERDLQTEPIFQQTPSPLVSQLTNSSRPVSPSKVSPELETPTPEIAPLSSEQALKALLGANEAAKDALLQAFLYAQQ